jgi:hypothetical protein
MSPLRNLSYKGVGIALQVFFCGQRHRKKITVIAFSDAKRNVNIDARGIIPH